MKRLNVLHPLLFAASASCTIYTSLPPKEGTLPLIAAAAHHHAGVVAHEIKTAHENAPKRTVTFKNNITSSKTGYTLGFFTYKPVQFKISINDTVVAEGSTVSLPVHDTGNFVISYDYHFFPLKPGYRHVQCKLKPGSNYCTIDFSWYHQHRFILDTADVEKIVKIYEPGSEYASK